VNNGYFNLFVSSNDNIEMLVEIINRNQSKLVAQSSKKENLFVKSDPTYECQDFNIDSVVNFVNRKISDSMENIDDIETLVETLSVNNGYFLYGKLDRKSDLLP
jgi:hypothetical protein